ncbi:MAG: adenylyl-sulfate kinase [Gammaproteobacteria bacterium]|nr:adenylyl-sulfate kinase [Gammaproteobacteria bacterium]
MTALPSPHGGKLTELLVSPAEAAQYRAASKDFPSWDLTAPQLSDLELLLTGAFSPLIGFMNQADYASVLQHGRLANGLLWPIPIMLDVTEKFAEGLSAGQPIALRDPEGVLLAVMQVTDIWRPDKSLEATQIHGSRDNSHPGVHFLLHQVHPVYLGGRVFGIELPAHYDFIHLRLTPREVREAFTRAGWRKTVAVHTQQPMHRAQIEAAAFAARMAEANLFIHPVAGPSNPGDGGHYTRIRCHEQALRYYPEGSALLSLLPLPLRHAGPREALLFAIIRKNFGCSHILMMDSAGGITEHSDQPLSTHQVAPGVLPLTYREELMSREAGRRERPTTLVEPFAVALPCTSELGIEILPVHNMLYVEERAEYLPSDQVKPTQRVLALSNTELTRRLAEDLEIPPWFSYPEIVAELRRIHLPKYRQGVTLFFTGLSGSGKSTIARALLAKLMELGNRSVTLLDGDVVRKHLSSELGFSREHRNLNILRIGFVASEITKHGGIAICAPIAPYEATRRQVREMMSAYGGFIEIYVSTPLEICERRDRKGLYAKARAGLIKEFTGISDPYEIPQDAELVIDTQDYSPLEAAQLVLNKLAMEGYLR